MRDDRNGMVEPRRMNLDSSGVTTTARDRMPLMLEQMGSGRKQERITRDILPFDAGSAEMRSEGIASLKEVVEQVGEDARIVITGHASADEDTALARERAESVARLLRGMLERRRIRKVTMTVGTVGEDRPADDPPENGILSRRVEIVAEQESRSNGEP
jgi:outer membrane protein OmpA-like peptidoglycan-associated protein